MDDLNQFISDMKSRGYSGKQLDDLVQRYKSRTVGVAKDTASQDMAKRAAARAKGVAADTAKMQANKYVQDLAKKAAASGKGNVYTKEVLDNMAKRYAARLLGNTGKTLLKVGGVIGSGALAAVSEAAGPQGSFEEMKANPNIDTGETKEQYNARQEQAAMVRSRKANPGRTQMFQSPALKNAAYAGQSKLSKYMGVGKK